MLAKTTLDEVARKAGVSTSTVSRTLSGAHGVNEGTRQKVLAAVREVDIAMALPIVSLTRAV